MDAIDYPGSGRFSRHPGVLHARRAGARHGRRSSSCSPGASTRSSIAGATSFTSGSRSVWASCCWLAVIVFEVDVRLYGWEDRAAGELGGHASHARLDRARHPPGLRHLRDGPLAAGHHPRPVEFPEPARSPAPTAASTSAGPASPRSTCSSPPSPAGRSTTSRSSARLAFDRTLAHDAAWGLRPRRTSGDNFPLAIAGSFHLPPSAFPLTPMSLLVVGSIAIDNVETPWGRRTICSAARPPTSRSPPASSRPCNW